MRLTRHNGRANSGGAYSAKHNDRQFDLDENDHIDADRSKQNIYWDLVNGPRIAGADGPDLESTFEDAERFYYSQFYRNFIEGQNARNEKNRHTGRNRTADNLRTSKKTCPEETIFQIGTKDDHVPYDVLSMIVDEFMIEFQERFGDHVRILDWALHVDESTPHIHERHVFECENRYGELCPQQEKALEALGFELPEPDKKPGRYNNRKIVFDSACRVMLFDIARRHGLQLEEEPEYGGRKYLEKQDFILMKQRQEIAAGNAELEKQSDQLTDQAVALHVKSSNAKSGRADGLHHRRTGQGGVARLSGHRHSGPGAQRPQRRLHPRGPQGGRSAKTLKAGEMSATELDGKIDDAGYTRGTRTRAKAELKSEGKIRYIAKGFGRDQHWRVTLTHSATQK